MNVPHTPSNEPQRHPLHGFLLLDKPAGITSQQAISALKSFLPRKWKIGHAGTLDPFATGLLPVALGEATKALQWVMLTDKRYQFTVKFGEATDTLDNTGVLTERSTHLPQKQALHQSIAQFLGDISQVPPAYSAIQIGGRRAYAMARAGEEVVLEPRQVTIHQLAMQEGVDTRMRGHDEAGEVEASFDVTCSKGTYVRSLARDIAESLGTVGHVTALRRLEVGKFSVESAISLDFAREEGYKANLSKHLLSLDSVLDDIPALECSPAEALALRQGRHLPSDAPEGTVFRCRSEDHLEGMGIVEAGWLKPLRMFNLPH